MMSLTFGLFTQVSGSGPLGPLVYFYLWKKRLDFSCKSSARQIFSSPEHEVLMVSYCDQSMSVVRHASSFVNNLF